MKFKFKCELCGKEVKRGDKFELELFRSIDETVGVVVDGAGELCKACATKIERKIQSLRK